MATILVVEDTQTDAERVRMALAPYRWELKFVMSSTEARCAIQEELPVAIVLDILLPDDTGFQLCRDLKADPVTAKIPIIMCSSKSTDIDRFWALKQGAAFFLAKPIDPIVLAQFVRQLVPEPEPIPESLPLPIEQSPIHPYAHWNFLAS
ncbi:response regulator receiver protein [Leptolyngbya sp. NIES-3755]|nr:response regulator receiver protein [Leptolyngbya sp. NIES-3755]